MNYIRSGRLWLCKVLLLTGWVVSPSTAIAVDLDDPFATLDKTPAKICQKPQVAHALNLAEIVEFALCNNPQTHIAWGNIQLQAAQKGLAKSAYLPTLSGILQQNHLHSKTENQDPSSATSYEAKLSLSYLLYDFGVRAATLESNQQLLIAATALQNSTQQNVFLSALQAFYQTHARHAALTAAEQSERSAHESLTAAEARYQTGTATPTDRLQAKTAYSQASLLRLRAAGELKNAYGQLANTLGLNANYPLQLAPLSASMPSENFEENIEKLMAMAKQLRPDLQAAEAQLKAAQANIEAARAGHWPTLSLSAIPAYQNVSGLYTQNNTIGFSLNIPLFSGFNQTYKQRAAEAAAALRTNERDRLQLQITLEVWQSHQNLVTATQALRSSEDLLKSAEASEKVSRGRYNAGLGNILELLNAQTALTAARQQQVQAFYDWNVSRATLAQAIGSLDQRILQSTPADDSNTQRLSLTHSPTQ